MHLIKLLCARYKICITNRMCVVLQRMQNVVNKIEKKFILFLIFKIIRNSLKIDS